MKAIKMLMVILCLIIFATQMYSLHRLNVQIETLDRDIEIAKKDNEILELKNYIEVLHTNLLDLFIQNQDLKEKYVY